ncbi:MAG: hypothetical protein Cpurp_10485 [Chlorogloea purpurea SAG 13.99]|nr:hypothetical protein [Chlorogloea purpurea SAG 13.99]
MPWVFFLILASSIGLIGGTGLLLSTGMMTVGGIPASMITRFIQDPVAMEAFTSGNRKRLHERLQELGFEEEIKDYYRPRISDEVELDRYIHQLMYYWSGYVGDNYMVNSQKELVLKSSRPNRVGRELEPKK